MPRLAKLLLAVVLVGAAGYCAFGFLATYEPPGSPALRLVYAAAGLASLAGAAGLAFRSRGGRSGGLLAEPRRRDGKA